MARQDPRRHRFHRRDALRFHDAARTSLYGYDPKTGKLYPLVADGFGTYNLATIMGGGEVVFELNDTHRPRRLEEGLAPVLPADTARRDVVARDTSTGTEGMDGQYARAGRLAGYLYTLTKNAAYAKKAWSGVRVPRVAGAQIKGPDVVTPIEDVMGLSTNSVAQGCLEAIEVLEMCGDQMR